jgi:hypothetical protein
LSAMLQWHFLQQLDVECAGDDHDAQFAWARVSSPTWNSTPAEVYGNVGTPLRFRLTPHKVGATLRTVCLEFSIRPGHIGRKVFRLRADDEISVGRQAA